MNGSRKPNWLDLPEGIIELIINKLHFPDQIRALAICKTWRVCKDYVRCSSCLPWVMSHHKPVVDIDVDIDLLGDGNDDDDGGFNHIVDSNDDDDDWFDILCDGNELFDPYSRKVHKVPKSVMMEFQGRYIPITTKNGWVWVLFVGFDSSKVFLHNPFTNEICSDYPFPKMRMNLLSATIKGNPASLEYEIFMLRVCADELHVDIVKRDSYTSDAIVKKLAEKYDFIYDALFINGCIYCLFRGGTLYRYDLEDGSWNLLTLGFQESFESRCAGAWLLEIKGNLIMVCVEVEDETHKWQIFRFDWSKTSWVVETSLKSCAMYISDYLSFCTPLRNNTGEIVEGCKLFHFSDGALKCYCLSEAGGVEIQSEEYSWITRPSPYDLSFIERPPFGI